MLYLTFSPSQRAGKTNKSVHLCLNEAHPATQLVWPSPYILYSHSQRDTCCAHMPPPPPPQHHRRAASLVGSLYPGPGSQPVRKEYNCYAEFLYAHAPQSSTSLPHWHLSLCISLLEPGDREKRQLSGIYLTSNYPHLV